MKCPWTLFRIPGAAGAATGQMQAALAAASDSCVSPWWTDMCIWAFYCLSGPNCDNSISSCSRQVALMMIIALPSICRPLHAVQLWYVTSHSFLYRFSILRLVCSNADLCSGTQVNKAYWERYVKRLFGRTCRWLCTSVIFLELTINGVQWSANKWACTRKWQSSNATPLHLPGTYWPVIK
jgi:hypothetical protein